MAWTDLPTDYTDATFDGLRKFVEITNSDNTVSFQDVTAYSNKEKSFFGAKDANQTNKGINDVMKVLDESAGKKLAGKTVTVDSESVTAGDGAEIFNDYRERVHPEGGHGSIEGNVASGQYSTAHGSKTTATGDYSFSGGCETYAYGKCSSAYGRETIAEGDNSTSYGSSTRASGDNSTAKGYMTTASGKNSEACGDETQSDGENALAHGFGARAVGDNSSAEGEKTTALGENSHVEGLSDNIASSEYSADTSNDEIILDWSSNNFSLAKGTASHAEGKNVLALGDNSHAEGNYTIASGNYSHAEGNVAKAKGQASHAEGQDTQANGIASHAGGHHTVAGNYQFVTGKYNTAYDGAPSQADQSANSTLFIIGNGIQNTTSNAFRVTGDGQCYGLKAFSAQGADFAEYFEWADGNLDNEDRRGKFVTLDGDKIKLANDGDYILGIVTGSGAFMGNSQSENWQGKYSKDVFGDWLTQTVEVPESTDEETGEIIPAHTVTQYVVNPDYDPDTDYIAREFRKEWSPVGMLGQVTLVDDGTCTVNGYCKPSINGVGTASDSGYRVLKRLDESHVKVLVK